LLRILYVQLVFSFSFCVECSLCLLGVQSRRTGAREASSCHSQGKVSSGKFYEVTAKVWYRYQAIYSICQVIVIEVIKLIICQVTVELCYQAECLSSHSQFKLTSRIFVMSQSRGTATENRYLSGHSQGMLSCSCQVSHFMFY
jgi:hypothetical protein